MNRCCRTALAALLIAVAGGAAAQSYIETPALAARVAAGELPAVAERLPHQPLLTELSRDGWRPGRHGGDLRLLMAKAKDIRQLTVYGYARLLGYDEQLQLRADLLAGYSVREGREFTLQLRPGHRWSDGQPFTSEDFRFYWEHIANDADLSPGGPDKKLLVEGRPPQVEFPDAHTVIYRWHKPNPYFLTALAAPRPLFIYRPAHYLRPLHKAFATDLYDFADQVLKSGARNWISRFQRLDRPYRASNPARPSLQPWVNTTAGPSEHFTFVRNPYYHRVDANGRQLPYIDRVLINIASNKLIPAKTGAGESDLQARYLRFDNYTFLKQAEARSGYRVRLWRSAKGAHLALYPNLNTADPGWRELLREADFRRALSLAIDRREINQVVYFGLVEAGNNTVREACPLYRPEYRERWADFDLARANRLLDGLGLSRRDSRGVRLLDDGRPLEITVQTAGESTEQSDVLALIHDSWLRAGIKLYVAPSVREVFRNRIFSGEAQMAIWGGLENGMPTADSSPEELAPSNRYQYQWPQWGSYVASDGATGEPPALPAARQLVALHDAWRAAPDRAARAAAWHRMLEIHSRELFTIGIVSGVLVPVVVNQRLRNVPEQGLYNFEPGAYFGIYRPDSFWFDSDSGSAED